MSEFDPENDQVGIRIASARIVEQLNFRRGMLVRVPEPIAQRLHRAVITPFVAVNVLAVEDRRYFISCVILAIAGTPLFVLWLW
ncbi:hypothetical protein K420107F6_19400 [Lactonifactor longoviformis]